MKRIIYFIAFISSLNGISQVTPDKVREVFIKEISIHSHRLDNELLIEKFYQISSYNLMWMRSQDVNRRKDLLGLLSSAEVYGLDETNYQFDLIRSLNANKLLASAEDTILADIRLTEAAIHFLSDIKYGNKAPELRYAGIDFEFNKLPIAALLSVFYTRSNLNGLIEQVESHSREYINTKKLLTHFNKTILDKQFSEVTIKSTKVNNSNSPLLVKLFQLGVLDSIYAIEEKVLVQKVKKVQHMLNLLSDGVLGSTSMKALNIPIWRRREEIKMLLNRIRWVEGIKQDSLVGIINIPSASFFVYSHDTISLYSRIIVGKPSTPTPTLSSRITEVIAYPYWTVPTKIATKELLPTIKRNIGYLDNNNFQVLNKQGKVLNPYKIDWKSLSASNFPYTLRQSTGCDNALGVLKFNFYNPFTVYLHDTPTKGLFYLNKRYFSHGCMRLEKPVELAQILLKEKAAFIDSLTRQCLKEQKPKSIPISEPLPLIVLYSTAWYNEKGEIQFFEDAYHRLIFERPGIVMSNE